MKQNNGQLHDKEIISRILLGEKSLYELIVRRFNPYLYRIGRSYRYDHETTQDLMQDTYVDAFRNLHQFKQQADIKTWLIRIMLNNCYKKKQRSSYKNELAQDNINENVLPMFNNADSDTYRQVYNRELGKVIEQAVERIPEKYRLVFSLREINGLNVSETAKVLDISEINVKVRLNRAKAILRKELEKSYAPMELYEFNLVYCDAMVSRVMKEIEGE
ncbi:sigma-70 family RNA polymerase sigma factor [Sphingobacterium sp. InxBP1]|uniref:sigma-70 family RNA polymerase sigma factor n=1 Tax=Sphingobacterium sp. InxBP1 TaxID=2870328 RepID=UPI0022440DD4|nr:sigma-70 family RNA polymerase sigma factor [Sphingobacterium sp. InxBP1]MCW8313691.1 sigma-70 family RNA polymerase sigma factor [Sphingobacterium sp. InxBP1]